MIYLYQFGPRPSFRIRSKVFRGYESSILPLDLVINNFSHVTSGVKSEMEKIRSLFMTFHAEDVISQVEGHTEWFVRLLIGKLMKKSLLRRSLKCFATKSMH